MDNGFYLRQVNAADVKLIFDWANDPLTRKQSFSSEPIPYETHAAWFERRLKESENLFLMAMDGEDNPVGSIRLDRLDSKELSQLFLLKEFTEDDSLCVMPKTVYTQTESAKAGVKTESIRIDEQTESVRQCAQKEPEKTNCRMGTEKVVDKALVGYRISYQIAPDRRGSGYGKKLIQTVSELLGNMTNNSKQKGDATDGSKLKYSSPEKQIINKTAVTTSAALSYKDIRRMTGTGNNRICLVGEVRPDNPASIRCFEADGYKAIERENRIIMIKLITG